MLNGQSGTYCIYNGDKLKGGHAVQRCSIEIIKGQSLSRKRICGSQRNIFNNIKGKLQTIFIIWPYRWYINQSRCVQIWGIYCGNEHE